MKKIEDIKRQLNNGLIVSCQALEHETMYSENGGIMPLFALASQRSGAAGIRANSVRDIKEISEVVSLPIIGIIKKKYEGFDQHITATMSEIDQLYTCGTSIIALDCTDRPRPDGRSNIEFIHAIKSKYPDIVLMADISNYKEGMMIKDTGVDFIGTTLSGYTSDTCEDDGPDFELVNRLAKDTDVPIIAEGRIHHPKDARKMLELGAFCVVVGGAITRPEEIATRFVKAIKN